MRKILRLVAIALLAATLPVQGLASVVAAQCMAAGNHEGAAPEGHAHADGGGSHDHGTAVQEIDDNDASAAHCGPCTACCASASIAAPVAVFVVPSSSYSRYFFSQFPPRGIEPQALDRPPLAL
jgi:hypothetical protein